MSAQQNRIERSLKRLGFQLGKGRGKVARFREVLAAERKAGKAVGYMSVVGVSFLDEGDGLGVGAAGNMSSACASAE